MTRPIKFRAWDTKNEVWTFATLGDLICGACKPDGDKPLSGAKQIWEQSTGLKDKNGEEIYEGDIIESWYLNGDGNGGYYDAGNFEVVFKNGAFGVMRKENFYTFDEIECDEVEDMFVISNIHENPELLEDNK